MTIKRFARGGFTLVEVILAVFIAVGLLMVAISFYQQSARLRGEILAESERLAAVRLMMDRMTSDLRGALPEPQEGFTGTADSMRFVRTGLAGLALVSYEAAFEGVDTNAAMIGFNRIERLATETIAEPGATNAVPFSFSGDDLFGTNNIVVGAEPTTRAIRHARFRYFDGRAWVESWNSSELPVGVEISLGLEPLDPEAEATSTNAVENAPEIFRRVVHLPAGRAAAISEAAGDFDPFLGGTR